MEDAQPRAEALAIRDGFILAVGAKAEVMRHAGSKTEVVDLAGRALLPGFVDRHGHVVGGGLQASSANLLAPPDGDVTDIPSLQRVLRRWHAENANAVKRLGMIIGFGYESATMAERRHPTAAELDAVSTELPVYLTHQSGHFGAANSRALQRAGFNAKTPDPAGGIIRRLPDGSPNGVLEEMPVHRESTPRTTSPRQRSSTSSTGWRGCLTAGVGLQVRPRLRLKGSKLETADLEFAGGAMLSPSVGAWLRVGTSSMDGSRQWGLLLGLRQIWH